jgi:Family of unknown function (DUF6512)
VTTRRNWTVLRFELIGAVVMVLAGSGLHFAFDWAGGWRPLAVIAAVNESVWEHLKLAFWPGALWALFAPVPDGLRRADLMAAKGLTLLVTAVLIVAVFRSYTAILGRNLLPLDIGTFVLAILIGQALSATLLSRGALSGAITRRAGLVLFGAQLAAYGLLTFFPLDHWLFIEARSGLRGIPAR